MDKLIIEFVEVCKVHIFGLKVVFKCRNGAFHVQDSEVGPIDLDCTNRKKMSIDSFGGDHSKLIKGLQLPLHLSLQDFVLPMHELEALLIGKLNT